MFKLPNYLLAIAAFLTFYSANAQHGRGHQNYCGNDRLEQLLIAQDPQLAAQIEAADQQAILDAEAIRVERESNPRSGPILVVPVVFHILHDNGVENISDNRVKEAIADLNLDFSMSHPHLDDVHSAFVGVIGNPELEFRLAKLDPNGNPTTGIVRYKTTSTYTADDQAKVGRGWPRGSYLNVWVANTIDIGGPVAGYSYRPQAAAGLPNADGVMVEYSYVGGNDDSHTLAHEVGHWANLKHPWGGTNDAALPTNCNDDDDVLDTPNTIGTINGCNLTSVSCGSQDNIQNIMDYANCPAMFTEGQSDRMRAAMLSATAQRSNLWTSANLAATGVSDLVEADFSTERRVVCPLEVVEFRDGSCYGATSWDWTFQSGDPATSSDQHPTVTYYDPGVYEVSLTASVSGVSQNKTESKYIMVTAEHGVHLPYSEDFESVTSMPTDEWLNIDVDRDIFGFDLHTTNGYSGSNSIKMNNFGNSAGRTDEIISTAFDFSTVTDVEVTFWVAYAESFAGLGNDNLRLYVSTDCGENWTLKWIEGGPGLATVSAQPSSWEPSGTNEWAMKTVNNFTAGDLTQNTLLRFEFVSASGNNLYLDDININGTFKPEPQLQNPPDASVNRPADVLLDWKAVPGISGYSYELATDAGFSNIVSSGSTTYINEDPGNADTEFQTSGLTFGQEYFWRVKTDASGWSEEWSFTVDPDGVGIDEANQLVQGFRVFPNPLTADSRVEFNLPSHQTVQLAVFDLFGRQLQTLETAGLSAGQHQYQINGEALAQGIYLVRLTIDGQDLIQKVVVD